MYTFSLPLPPPDAEYLKQGPHGGYIGKAGQRYRRAVKVAVLRLSAAALSHYKGAELAVRVIINPSTRQRSMTAKLFRYAILDALSKAGVWNDAQVQMLLEVTGEPVAGGAVKITVKLLDNSMLPLKIAA
jgi:Holliday junction resolvase RusA-like endonuclease